MSGGEFAAIEARAAAATEGPWTAETTGVAGGDHWYVCDAGEAIASISCNDGTNEDQRQPDAEFIAHSRTDVETLLAAVRERDNTIARAEAAVASAALKVLADFDTVMNVKSEVAYIVAEYNRALRAALDPQETE